MGQVAQKVPDARRNDTGFGGIHLAIGFQHELDRDARSQEVPLRDMRSGGGLGRPPALCPDRGLVTVTETLRDRRV